MIGLLLETERCPDGVHLVDGFFRPRSKRREPVRVVSADLNKLIVLDFINARDNLAPFLSRYTAGSLFGLTEWPRPRWVNVNDLPAALDEFYARSRMVRASQQMLRENLVGVSGPDPLREMLFLDAESAPIFLRAALNLQDGKPQMLLRCGHLLEFMRMEVAMVALEGAKVVTCEHCKNLFLTGPGTSRRSDATFCSDRCRVAAMRARKKEASNVNP